ncbi:DNA ligase [Methylophaga frappieri]|uniref:DNA ligase n=1 Tax=Methylophaga frappieri (strain ATCC BAA-2434 / DSM 25690 / JAM7) TaxID=754477 RepID=I1YJP8_METFJ|nr:DNA ligase [Methylophaga frappieri]
MQLASVYQPETAAPVSAYLISEKYDGVRAIWTGTQLLTRNGNVINAPDWFTDPLPDVWLDGELWTTHQDFARLSGIVRTQIPDDAEWQQVSYRVFDMPDSTLPFELRYQHYTQLITQLNSAHIKPVQQVRVQSQAALQSLLKDKLATGAEGLMLHLATAKHRGGRTRAVLKLKPYEDAEAVVIGHLPGKGKYINQLGALRVKNEQGQIFAIGSGLSDQDRASPPPIGTIITYRYQGYTKTGLPRFARFIRIREPDPD